MLHPKTILRAHGISPRKGLGQNFLNDENVLDRIISAADIEPEMTVVEVGPGLGHLTERLAHRAGCVIADS